MTTKKQYAFLNTVYYHGPNVKLLADIVLRGALIVSVLAGTVKYLFS